MVGDSLTAAAHDSPRHVRAVRVLAPAMPAYLARRLEEMHACSEPPNACSKFTNLTAFILSSERKNKWSLKYTFKKSEHSTNTGYTENIASTPHVNRLSLQNTKTLKWIQGDILLVAIPCALTSQLLLRNVAPTPCGNPAEVQTIRFKMNTKMARRGRANHFSADLEPEILGIWALSCRRHRNGFCLQQQLPVQRQQPSRGLA